MDESVQCAAAPQVRTVKVSRDCGLEGSAEGDCGSIDEHYMYCSLVGGPWSWVLAALAVWCAVCAHPGAARVAGGTCARLAEAGQPTHDRLQAPRRLFSIR